MGRGRALTGLARLRAALVEPPPGSQAVTRHSLEVKFHSDPRGKPPAARQSRFRRGFGVLIPEAAPYLTLGFLPVKGTDSTGGLYGSTTGKVGAKTQ